MTQQLSPAAQAVQFATFRVYDEEEHLYVVPAEKHAGMVAAAALRAAADQVVPTELDLPPIAPNLGHFRQHERRLIRQRFLSIADELEAQ